VLTVATTGLVSLSSGDLLQATERTVDGLTPQGGTHDGPLRRWSAWLVAPGAAGAGAAERYGSPGDGADRAGTGAADGGRGGWDFGARGRWGGFLRCWGLREAW